MSVAEERSRERDRAAILRLMRAYCDTIDRGDLEACAELFSEGSWGIEGGLVFGKAAVLDELRNVTLYDGCPLTRHLMSNVQLELSEDGSTATGESCLTVMQAVPPTFPLQAIFIGSYSDRFRQKDGRWLFVERRIRPDLVGEMSYHRADMARAGS